MSGTTGLSIPYPSMPAEGDVLFVSVKGGWTQTILYVGVSASFQFVVVRTQRGKDNTQGCVRPSWRFEKRSIADGSVIESKVTRTKGEAHGLAQAGAERAKIRDRMKMQQF